MKKSLMLCLTICCFAVSSLFAADSKEMFKNAFDKMESLKGQGISCDINVVTGTKNKKNINTKAYMKGENIRLEADGAVTIIREDCMYLFSEQEKAATKLNIDKENIKQIILGVIQNKAGELKFVKGDSKNGYSCQVFKSKDNSSNAVYYLTDDYGLPTYVKEEMSETNITNFKVGNVDDNLFVLPKDVKIVEISNFSPENLLQSI